MYLLRLLDFLALIGLFVQAFVAWAFVALLSRLGPPPQSRDAFRAFWRAFLLLALGLTVMSWRFFRAHDVENSYRFWKDGRVVPVLCYAFYMGTKSAFGFLLVRGAHRLGGRPVQDWVRRAEWPTIVLSAAAPLAWPGIVDLLVLQAPVMVACSWAAVRPLRGRRETGLRLVTGALVAHAVVWVGHGVAASLVHVPVMQSVLSMNSFLDLGVELALGIGLVVSLLQDAHAQLMAAEQERETLRRRIERSEKLRALGKVVSGVAHELNNPLTVIVGYAEDLRAADPESEAARVVAEQAERCRGIVRNLSALAGQAVHPRQDLDLEETVRRVVRGLSQGNASEGRSVRVEPMHGLRCTADRIGLEQVLANLIVNALHASPPGGVVTVAARGLGDDVEVLVADEGPGVAADLRDQLFEPFFTTKAPGSGTGLGLSIAHSIVRGHGGTITVEDAAGGGALFRVTLPGARNVPQPAPPRAPARVTDKRLLVVDDDAAVCAVVRAHAERRGWEVALASSAEDALEGSLTGAHAVLCDLRMPGIGGIGLHDRLRDHDPRLLERVVFATGDLASTQSLRFAERCARPLLHKPFDYDELFARLAEAAQSTA